VAGFLFKLYIMKPEVPKHEVLEGDPQIGDTVLFPYSWVGTVDEITIEDELMISASNQDSVLISEARKFKKIKLL
jgi:hypothetical protein